MSNLKTEKKIYSSLKFEGFKMVKIMKNNLLKFLFFDKLKCSKISNIEGVALVMKNIISIYCAASLVADISLLHFETLFFSLFNFKESLFAFFYGQYS